MSTGKGSLLGTSVLVLQTDQAPLNRGLAEARLNADRTGAQMQATMDRRMVSMGKSLGKTGSTLTRNLTLPILAGFAATGDAAVKFQQNMEMIHTQAGASQGEVKKLSGEVLNLAKILPQGPQQLAQGLFHLESIGLRGAKAMDTLKVAAEGAAVGNANLEDTATALGSAWLVNIKGAGDLHQVMGILNATVGAGNVRMGQLVEALGTGVLPAAKLAGLGLKDVMGALAVFTDEGYPASSAAAQMATALHYLYDPTKKASDALASIGLSSTAMASDMHKPNGLLLALSDLKDHLDTLPGGIKGVPAEQVLGAIFPGGRGRVLLTLLNQLDRYQRKLTQIGRTSANFSKDVTATQQTAAFKLHVAWSNIEADAIQFGDKVLPDLLNRAADIAGIADKVVTDFTRLPKGLQDAIITGGLVAAGVGPAMKILGVFTGGVGRLLQAARIAQRISTTPLGKGFLGGALGRTATPTISGSQSVATMEVGTLIAKTMVGGIGATGMPVGAPGAATAAERGALPAGMTATESGLIVPTSAAAGTAGLVAAEQKASFTLSKALPYLAGIGLLANGLREAIGGHGGGLQGLEGRFAHGASAGLLPSNLFAVKGFAGPTPVMKLDAQIKAVQGDLSKLTPEALVKLKQQAEKLAADPSLSHYREFLLRILGGLSNVANSAEGQGRKIAQGLEHGWNSYKFQSEPTMLRQLEARVKGLPPQMQAGAIKSVIAYARGLEAKGKLPAGSWQLMLAEIQHQFPDFQRSLGSAAALSAETFTKQLDLTKAEGNVKSALASMSHDFPQVSQAMDKTKGDVLTKAAAAAKALRSIDVSGSAPMLAAVTGDMAKLRRVVTAALTKSVAVSQSSAKDMAHSIEQGSTFAAATAETNFNKVQSAVGRAMNSGILSTGQGAKLIGQALNAMLTAFGAKPVPLAGFSTAQVLNYKKFFQQGATGSSPGPGHRATGGMMVNHPTYIVGEEAPRHPEIVLASNPAYRRRNLDLWHTAGQMLGVPGFATGGIVTASEFTAGPHTASGRTYVPGYAELSRNYSAPLGSLDFSALGHLPMGTILPVGFGGKTIRIPKIDVGAGGPGLGGHIRAIDLSMQAAALLPGFPGLANVLVGGAAGIGGMGSQIPVPKVSGTGTMATIARAALSMLAKDANQYLAAHRPQVSIGTPIAPSGGSGPFFVPSQLAPFDGYEVAKWIIQELLWARAHGWGGHVTSGWRSPTEVVHGVFATAPQGKSEHQYDVYPHGAVDVSDYTQFASIIAGYPGAEKLIQLPIDPLHFSGTGHARGGIIGNIPGFAGGGITGHGGHPDRRRRRPRGGTLAGRHGFPDKRPPQHKHAGATRPPILPLSIADPKVGRAMHLINTLLGNTGQVAQLREIYQHTDDFFQLHHPNLNYVVSQDKFGNPIAPFIDQVLGPDGMPTPDINSKHAVNASLGELGQLHTWQYSIVHDEERALKIIPRVIEWIHRAIEKRQRHVARLRRQIEANLRKIRRLREQQSKPDPKILKLRQAINSASANSTPASINAAIAEAEGIYVPPGKAGEQARADRDKLIGSLRAKLVLAEHGSKVSLSSLRNELLAVEQHDSDRKRRIGLRITDVEQRNRKLGGTETAVGSSGEIGRLRKEIGTLAGYRSTLLSDQLNVQGASGQGGSLEQDKLQLATLAQQINQLSPAALRNQLRTAQASFSGASDSQLISDLQSALATEAQTVAIEKAEIRVLGQPLQLGPLPPFGGSFAMGGIVPGPAGEPRTIIAHGGEEFLGVGEARDGRTIQVIILDGAVDPNKIRVIAGEETVRVTRAISRNAGRQLPGRGGGLIR